MTQVLYRLEAKSIAESDERQEIQKRGKKNGNKENTKVVLANILRNKKPLKKRYTFP